MENANLFRESGPDNSKRHRRAARRAMTRVTCPRLGKNWCLKTQVEYYFSDYSLREDGGDARLRRAIAVGAGLRTPRPRAPLLAHRCQLCLEGCP